MKTGSNGDSVLGRFEGWKKGSGGTGHLNLKRGNRCPIGFKFHRLFMTMQLKRTLPWPEKHRSVCASSFLPSGRSRPAG